MPALRFVYKMTSELTRQDIQDILNMLNNAFLSRRDEAEFRWKYLDNPYGESLHMIAYDNSQSVGSMAFWRNDLQGITPAYQCVDLVVIPSHQRRGIFQVAGNECVKRLPGAYLYTFPNRYSQPGFYKLGWTLQRKIPISVHLPGGVLRHYAKRGPIPDQYAVWRFVRNPETQYFVYPKDGQFFLLSKREKSSYIVGGMLSNDFGLPNASPRFLLSCDFPGYPLRLPRRAAGILENPCYVANDGFIPMYRSDLL